MGRGMNYVRGTVTLTAQGLFPERLLNLCAQEGVPCWGVEWLDSRTLRLTTYRQKLSLARELAKRAGCELTVEGRRGLPSFLGRFRRRYGFLLGFALSLAAVCVLSQFVLTIDVTGNETVSTARILSQLRQEGVRVGVYGPSLDRTAAAQRALRELEELSWMSINRYGTRLEVVVREAVQTPDMVEEEGFYHVAAETDGIITQVEPLAGEAAVEEGDTAAKGDVLISGLISIEPPLYSDQPVRYYETHARGRVWARTWRTLEAVIRLEAQVKRYTGEERTLWSLTVLDRRVDFYKNSSIPGAGYDKIKTVRQLALPGGRSLPMMLTAERFRAYETETVSVDRQAAQTLLEEELFARLQELVGEDGQVLDAGYTARAAEGLLRVVLTAECREEIGVEVPGSREIPGDAPLE